MHYLRFSARFGQSQFLDHMGQGSEGSPEMIFQIFSRTTLIQTNLVQNIFGEGKGQALLKGQSNKKFCRLHGHFRNSFIYRDEK